MTVLITGGMGYVGDQLTYEQADISEPGALLALAKKHGVNDIVHMAIHGQARVDAGADLRINMDKLSLLLDAARDIGVHRLSLASSGAPYFGVAKGPFKEDQPLPMDSVISPEAYKKAWEILTLNYAKLSGIDLVNMRLSGVYGPMYASMRNLPSRLCHAAAFNIEPDFSPGFGGVPFADDAQDLTFAKDIARGIVLVQQADKLKHQIYNIGSGRATSNTEFLEAVKTARPMFDTTFQNGRSPHAKTNGYADITRIRRELAYEPGYDLVTAVDEYISWLEAGNPQ